MLYYCRISRPGAGYPLYLKVCIYKYDQRTKSSGGAAGI
jgi:hypothetical protein